MIELPNSWITRSKHVQVLRRHKRRDCKLMVCDKVGGIEGSGRKSEVVRECVLTGVDAEVGDE